MNGEVAERTFTAEEATGTLPLVSRIAADIALENDRLQLLLPELRTERARARDSEFTADLERIRQDVARCTARLEVYLEELRTIGCTLHDPTGIIDYRATLDGRDIVLCWKLGEEEVCQWHEPGRSHDDRRLLPTPLVASPAGSDTTG